MYLISAVFLACLIVSTNALDDYPPKELLEMLRPMHSYCAQESGASEDELLNYDIHTKPRTVMCYMACIMDQSNWLSNEGEIKYDFIVDNPWVPIKDIMVPDVNQCRNVEVVEDRCEQVYLFAKCLYEVDPEHWFLP